MIEGGLAWYVCLDDKQGNVLSNLAEELFFQLIGPALVGLRGCCQMPYVRTLQHHLHTSTCSAGLPC